MTQVSIQEAITRLESELHKFETRQDPQRLRQLLHANFEEIGRSGRRYSRDEILVEFVDSDEFPEIVATDFKISELTEDALILTYRSAHKDADGQLHRHTLRSSVWVHKDKRWQMLFHQGTPTDA